MEIQWNLLRNKYIILIKYYYSYDSFKSINLHIKI
jgi:hypothetical protein